MAAQRPQDPEIIDIGGIDFDQIRSQLRLIIVGAIVALLVAWFAMGGPIYRIEPGELGVVLTFGKYNGNSTGPGMHFKMPWPVQTVEVVSVAVVRRVEVGFRSRQQGQTTYYEDFTNRADLLGEAQMLTGDENVVNCSLAVQYLINNPEDYLFNFTPGKVEEAIKDITEAALRQVVGDHPIDTVLTEGKSLVRAEVMERMQALANRYGMGVEFREVQLQDVKPPDQVKAAFQGVASAREEREQLINLARAYESERMPKAQGEAQAVLLAAEGYRATRIAESKGDVARFLAITKEFRMAPEITRTRLYLETLNVILPKVRLTVIDEGANLVNLKSLGDTAVPTGAAGALTQGR
jgi:membrane protease subunit HflK